MGLFGWMPKENIIYRSWSKVSDRNHMGKWSNVNFLEKGKASYPATFKRTGNIYEIHVKGNVKGNKIITDSNNVKVSKKINITAFPPAQGYYGGKGISYTIKLKDSEKAQWHKTPIKAVKIKPIKYKKMRM